LSQDPIEGDVSPVKHRAMAISALSNYSTSATKPDPERSPKTITPKKFKSR
jgi:hypothetical protein